MDVPYPARVGVATVTDLVFTVLISWRQIAHITRTAESIRCLTFGVDCSQVASAVGSTLSSTWSTVSGTASLPLRSTSMGFWQMAAARRFTSGECRVALNINTWGGEVRRVVSEVGVCWV